MNLNFLLNPTSPNAPSSVPQVTIAAPTPPSSTANDLVIGFGSNPTNADSNSKEKEKTHSRHEGEASGRDEAEKKRKRKGEANKQAKELGTTESLVGRV
jgi:hypothetical protein